MKFWKKGMALYLACVLALTIQPVTARAEENLKTNVQIMENEEPLGTEDNSMEDSPSENILMDLPENPTGGTVYSNITTEEGLTYALANAQDGDVLDITSTIYFSNTLEINKNVTIDAQNPYNTLVFVGDGTAIRISAPAGVEKVVLKNMSFQTDITGCLGVKVEKGSKVELNKVSFLSRDDETNLTYLENNGTVDTIDSSFSVTSADSTGIINSVDGTIRMTNASDSGTVMRVENGNHKAGIINYGNCTIAGGLFYVTSPNSAIIDNYGELFIEGGDLYSFPGSGLEATVIRQQDYTKTHIKGGRIHKGTQNGKVSGGLLVANAYFQPDSYQDGLAMTQSTLGADEIVNGIPVLAEPTQDLSEDTHYLINLKTDDTTIDMKSNSDGLKMYYTPEYDVAAVSSNPNVASVDNNNGILNILATGVTVVSVTVKTKDGSCIPGMQSTYFVSKCRVEVVDKTALEAKDITGRILEDISVIDPYKKGTGYHISYHLNNQFYDNTAGGGAEAFCVKGIGLTGDLAKYFSTAADYEQPTDKKFTDTFYLIPMYADENTLKFEQDGKKEFANSQVIIRLEGTSGKTYSVNVSANSIKLAGDKPVITMTKPYPVNSFFQASLEQSPMRHVKGMNTYEYDNLNSFGKVNVGKSKYMTENAEFSLAGVSADYELVNNQIRYKGNLEKREDTLDCYVQIPGYYGKSPAKVKVKVSRKDPDVLAENMKDDLEGKNSYEQSIHSKSNNNLILDSVKSFAVTGNSKFDDTIENSILRSRSVYGSNKTIISDVALKAGQVIGKKESFTLNFKFKNSSHTVSVPMKLEHKKDAAPGKTEYKLSKTKIVIDPAIKSVWDSNTSTWVNNYEKQSFFIGTRNNQINKNISRVIITKKDGTLVPANLHFTSTDMDFTGKIGQSVIIDAQGGTPAKYMLKVNFFDSSNKLVKELPFVVEVAAKKITIPDAKETIDLTLDRSSVYKEYGRIPDQKDYFFFTEKNYEYDGSFSSMKVYNLQDVKGEIEKRNCITINNADFNIFTGRNSNYDRVVSINPKENLITTGVFKPGHAPSKVELTYYDSIGRATTQMVTISYKKKAPKISCAKEVTLYKNAPYVECNLDLDAVYKDNQGNEISNLLDRAVIKELTLTDVNSPYDTRKAKNGDFYLFFKDHTAASNMKDGKVNIRVEFANSDTPVNLTVKVKIRKTFN